MTTVRAATHDIPASICFYRDRLGFAVELYPEEHTATLSKQGIRVKLTPPGERVAGHMPPNAISGVQGKRQALRVECSDLDGLVRQLRVEGVPTRGDIVDGQSERRVVIDDPSGNPIELYEPTR